MAGKAPKPEVQRFLEENPDVAAVDCVIADINGCLRGKRVRRDALTKVYTDGICLPGSLYALDITGTTVEATGLGFDSGDADQICRPVPGRLSRSPWQKSATGQVLMAMHGEDDQPYFADPRCALATVTARFSEMGLTPVVAVELEFYLIDRLRDRGRPRPPLSPATGEREASTQVYGMKELDDYVEFIEAVRVAAERQNLPADTAVSEYAPGQYEVNLRHRDDAVAACDDAILLKRLLKGVAKQFGMEATFMAKPYEDRAGNGLHVHVSLVDKDGRNVFAGNDALGSDALRHAIGGLKQTMAESTAIFAPTANSYRRYRADSFVPMSPTWGANNRTLALRIPAGSRDATRVEHRVAGADANPYLVMAAILAGMHHGITHRIDPGPPTEGNAYAQHPPSIPCYWNDALARFDGAAVLPSYLGEAFCHVYSACRWHECDTFNAHISPLEYEWYLRNV